MPRPDRSNQSSIDDRLSAASRRFTIQLSQRTVGDQWGKVAEVIGQVIRINGLRLALGELCQLFTAAGEPLCVAEAVGIASNYVVLSPFGDVLGITRGSLVRRLGRPASVPCGSRVLGRVLDAVGNPIDNAGPLEPGDMRPIVALPPSPMKRQLIEKPFITGIRSIDALITMGEGQRVGLFAPAGVGKSTLMASLAKQCQSDINVICLIGERGREVREFVELTLGSDGLERSVVFCATSDRPAIERAKVALAATTVAEAFRDRGKRVLLMMDSLTRYARALREIGLAAGEPPARRGYPPSIFAELPKLLERAGNGAQGSITAIYTVLAEDDTGSDPIAEEVRGLIDGHIILSRALAAKNQYPAIDLLQSLSRVMTMVTSDEHRKHAGVIRRLLSKFKEMEMLVSLGEYQPGQDAEADRAIDRQPQLIEYFYGTDAGKAAKFQTMLREISQLGAA